MSIKLPINNRKIKTINSVLWCNTQRTFFEYATSTEAKNLSIFPSILPQKPFRSLVARFSNLRYLEAKTGTRIIATAKLHNRENTTVKVKPEKICPSIPNSLLYITKGKKTQMVVNVLAVIAIIIS